MKLIHKTTFILHPLPPFHFDGTFHKPSHFPNNLKMNDWKPGKHWQGLRLKKNNYGVRIINLGTISKPKLEVTIYTKNKLTDQELQNLKQELVWRFELDVDLNEFNKLAYQDKRFYPIFKKWTGVRNSGQLNLYELLIIGIVLQNATVKRSSNMLDNLLDHYGDIIRFDHKELYLIWLPEKLTNVTEEELRNLKIGYRAKFIKKLSSDFASLKINEVVLRNKNSELIKKELTKLYGVGPETARILLFEAFHKYDTFEHIAPWQQKIYSRLFYGQKLIPTDKIRDDIKKQYGKYSMLAVHYIWEDIFWKRKNEHIGWLEKEIRL